MKKSDRKNKSKRSSSSESTSDSEDSESIEEKKINIVLSIEDDDNLDADYADYLDYWGEEELVDDEEDEDCDTDDEKTFMKETFESVETPKIPGFKKSKKEIKADKQKAKKKAEKKKAEDADKEALSADIEPEYLELLELKKDLTKKLVKCPNSKILKRAIKDCKESIQSLVKDTRKKNTKQYHKLIYAENNKPNEMNYFKTKLSNAEQLKIMRDLKEINDTINTDKPHRLALLESQIPPKLKAQAMQKINALKGLEPGDPEYSKMKNWIDTFMQIPFGRYTNLSVKMSDGLDVCHDFMQSAKETLDECVYGLDDAKLQIMQMMGQWVANPSAMGSAIAIKGPPGTGKTTLVKEGISKILGREFAFIALGGTGDASFLEGHSYTYEGSTWGKIVQIILDSKCMNPVIYFDELDKISDTPRGQEITGILTHLTDSTQNSQFHDKYFSNIDFDLSKCLFIFSYNEEQNVNPILKDRMYRIETKGYSAKEKLIIARQYMLPKIREQVSFEEGDIIIPDETINYIVSNKALTQDEAGVRNMKRCLEIIHTKLNLFRLVKPDNNMFSKDIGMEVKFPFTVEKKHVDILIKNDDRQSQSLLSMYV